MTELATHGFLNTGSNCYFNALLQALLGCEPFIRWVYKNKSHLKKTTSGKRLWRFINFSRARCSSNYMNLFKDLDKYLEEASANILSGLMKDLNAMKKFEHFRSGQQSASEALVILIEVLGMEKLFQINTQNIFTCTKCNNTNSVRDICMQVNMIIDDDATIESYKCDKCKSLNTTTKNQEILEPLPPIVVFCLMDAYKKERIEYTFTFDQENYDLRSQIEHFGRLEAGHYWTFSQRNDKYWLFDDKFHCLSRKANSTTKNTYMLFFSI